MNIKLSQVIKNLLEDRELTPEQKNKEVRDLLAKVDSGEVPEIEDDRTNAKDLTNPPDLSQRILGELGPVGDMLRGAGKNQAQIIETLNPSKRTPKTFSESAMLRYGGDRKPDTEFSNKVREEIGKPSGVAENLGGMASDMAMTMGSPISGALNKVFSSTKAIPSIAKAGASAIGETVGLNTAKGQDTSAIEAVLSGVLGGAASGVGEGVSEGSKWYLKRALNQGNNNQTPELAEPLLKEVLATDGIIPMSLSSVFEGGKKIKDEFTKAAAPKLAGYMSPKVSIEEALNRGLMGAYDTALTQGAPSKIDISKLPNVEGLVPQFEKSGKSVISTVKQTLDKNNPNRVKIPATTDKKGLLVPESQVDNYLNPLTGEPEQVFEGYDKLVNHSSLLNLLDNLENTRPAALDTPMSEGSNDFVNFLRETLEKNNQGAQGILKKRSDRQSMLGMLQGLIKKDSINNNEAIGVGKAISGASAGKLPYTVAALSSVAGPVKAARYGAVLSDKYKQNILPGILKAIAATMSTPVNSTIQGQR